MIAGRHVDIQPFQALVQENKLEEAVIVAETQKWKQRGRIGTNTKIISRSDDSVYPLWHIK